MMKYPLGIAILALAFSVSLFAQAKITFEGDGQAISFGEVVAGAKISRDVNVKNTGNATLNISNVRAQCGCTATLLNKMTLQPGESTKMSVTFDSKNLPPGKAIKHIYVTSNSNPDSIATFEFTAQVVVPITLNPPFFNFNQAKIDTAMKKVMTVSNTSAKAIDIESVTVEAKYLTLKLGKKHLKPGESTELEATLLANAPGAYQGNITLTTNNPDQPKVDVRYTAWINRR